jgi:ABC-type antimicrobial peptide transport system permease subunit
MRWKLLLRFVFPYLSATIRREWQLAVLVLVGLAPGVAVLTAWLNLAWQYASNDRPGVQFVGSGWLLPVRLLDILGVEGVLIGAGVATLLIGCLGLTNAYVASVERRARGLALLRATGLHKQELTILLLAESVGAGVVGSLLGIGFGIPLGYWVWPLASRYFDYPLNGFRVFPGAVGTGFAAGIAATVLFMGLVAIVAASANSARQLGNGSPDALLDSWRAWKTSTYGTLFAGALVVIAASPVLSMRATLILAGLTLFLSGCLTTGSWALTRFYDGMPARPASPLTQMAWMGLIRRPRHTAGLTLALTAGSYGTGLAAMAVAEGGTKAVFAVWVAAGVLFAAAGLVLTAAALAALERRSELGLLVALGVRPSRVRQMLLLEYGLIAVGGGGLGASLAFVNWAMAGGENWLLPMAIVAADLLAAVGSAWIGAAPILWLVSRQSPGKVLRI